ncbi:MAG: ferrochelatase [Candidatus Binatia bacterium]
MNAGTSASAATAPIGVLLLNLGGPERLEDVRPFLYNLFSDPAILRIRSAPLRKGLAWLIATARNRKSCGYYRKIGGGSPLRRLTEEQASALGSRLAAEGVEARVYVGMSCWKPTIAEAVERIVADAVQELVILPLYPQFSTTTTGSALEAVEGALGGRGFTPGRSTVIRQWCDFPPYVEALATTIREEAARFPDPEPSRIHLLYSAHSIPRRLVEEGDPYLEQTERTVARVNAALGDRSPWTLAFQSKVGPVKWLEPSTNDALSSLGAAGARQVLAVPVSFVSDHIETLYEIDLLYAGLAASVGIGVFRRAPALNARPDFVAALAALVRAARDGGTAFAAASAE